MGSLEDDRPDVLPRYLHGSLLVTPKMAPALAARVEASLRRNRRGAAGAVFAPRLISAFRFTLVVAGVLAVTSFVLAQRRDTRAFEAARASLLEAVRAESASLGSDRDALVRDEAWVVRLAGKYEGDFTQPELRGAGALAALVARPSVYVRGSIGALGRTSALEEAASSSSKDALLLCLLDPPASRSEKALLAPVRTAYANAATLEQRTAHVRRLHEAEVGLPLLSPEWASRVQTARRAEQIDRLRDELASAPLDAAKRAAHADLLIVAIDEAGEGSGPTELDGERPHWVRVGIVDLRADRVLVRARKRVDPSGLSAPSRAQYASGLDGCGLAFDLHESVRGVR